MIKSEARVLAKENLKNIDLKLHSKKCLNTLLENNYLDGFNKIGIYYPLKYEIDILDLIYLLNKEFYLPKTIGDDLYFIKLENINDLRKGQFGILEPVGDPVNLNELEAIIIPCLAISKDNKRLGYGKGYYDRALQNYNGLKIGVCLKELVGLPIEMEHYDLKLDIILRG